MKFCKECGHELKEAAQFCNECGTPILSNATRKDLHQPNKQETSISKPAKAPMSKKKKSLIISVIAIVILLIGAYKIGAMLTSKDRLVNKFQDALVKKDDKAVIKLLSSNDKQLKINEDSVKGFMSYLKKNPDEVNGIIKNLKEQSSFIDSIKNKKADLINRYMNSMPEGLINLEKDGKILFYDKYKLNIEPLYLSISTNYKNTDIYVDGKKVGRANTADFEKTYGPFVPGLHNVEAKLKTNFVELAYKNQISVEDGNKQSIDLSLNGENVIVNTEFSEEQSIPLSGKLFINGKDVGIDPFETPEFGPVLIDGSMTVAVEAEFPWGKMKSKDVVIDSDSVDVNLSNNEDFQNNIMETVVQNNRDTLAAYTSGDVTKMLSATQELKSSLTDSINYAKEDGELFKGQYIGTTFDLDSFRLYTSDDKWMLDVTMKTNLNSDTYYKDEKPELEDNEQTSDVTLVYDDTSKKWLVYSVNDTYFFNDENVKEIKEDKPLEYATTWNK